MSAQAHAGSCFCGTVKFELSGAPNVMGYCHCTDCAHWAGAPINAFSLWPPQSLTVTAGEDRIGTFAKTPGSERKFCTQCGGHVFTNHPAMGLVDVYLNHRALLPAPGHAARVLWREDARGEGRPAEVQGHAVGLRRLGRGTARIAG